MKAFSRREFIPLMGLTVLSTSCLSVTQKDEEMSMTKLKPRRLKKGDLIGVCAPAGAIKTNEEWLDFEYTLKSFGYNVKASPHLTERYGYFSATDEDRANDFMDLIRDKSVSGIFFVRGGWGCARMIEHLNFDEIKNNPKVIMGFSDITTLLNAISSRTGLVTFHGPGGNSSWNDYTMSYFKQLFHANEAVSFQNKSYDQKIKTLVEGSATGELYGGNLSVLSALIGSDYLPDWNGKILFLEDVMEEPYRIDRMLTQLKLAGVIDQVSGIVLGVFRECIPEEPEFSFTLEEVFDQHFNGLDIPVYYGAQFGHTKNKYILPVGVKVEMNASEGIITMLEEGLS